jgi:hypothetical protein
MTTETLCVDCHVDTLSAEPGVPTEYYSVHDALWAQAGMGPVDGMLCVGCLESRIGRRLNRADFTDAEINDLSVSRVKRFAWSWRSRRLRDRLSAPSAADGIQMELWS